MVRSVMAMLGKKGGKAGTGASKRRSRRHYVAAAKARWDAWRALKGGKASR